MEPPSLKRFLPDEAATIAFAEDVYAAMSDSFAAWTVLLNGDLGAGKSTFARGFIRAAGHSGAVPSPTYTMVEPYELPTGNIYHIDLYRVSGSEELRYLGWNEFSHGVRLVEWPDRAPDLEREADLYLTLTYADDARRVEVAGRSERGVQLLRAIGKSSQIAESTGGS